MFESLGKRRLGLGAAVLASGALALSGCGSSDKVSTKEARPSPVLPNKGTPDARVIYYPNGSRELVGPIIDSPYLHKGTNASYKNTEYFPDIYEFCDGRDLIEETPNYGTQAPSGVFVHRYVGAEACRDMRLSLSDFPKSPAEEVIIEH